MASFDHISGQEPSTISFKLATVTQTRNSSVMHQELLSIAGTESSLAVAAVLDTNPASTAWALAVRPVGHSSVVQGSTTWAVQMTQYSTTVNVSSLGGAVIVRSSAANALVTAYQSSAAELQATVTPVSTTWAVQLSQYSTIAAVSSVSGRVGTMPHSTLWASSAGFHFDGAGALEVAASFTGSTGPLTVSQLLDSSGGSVTAADSANNAIRVNVVAGAAGGSTIVTVSTVLGAVVVRSSAADFGATVTQASTVWAVQVGGYSTIAAISSVSGAVIVRSSAADFGATVTQASTTWAVQLTQYSTTANISSLAGAVICRSSAADMLVTASQGGAWSVSNISPMSSVAPSSGSSGLVVRQVIDVVNSAVSTSALASTSVSIISSVASIRHYITAYSITSTNQTAAHWGFFSSNATQLWAITLAALSSGVAGANLAVGAPAYLFRTEAQAALNFKSAGSTVAGVQLSVSYYSAP